MVPGGLEVAQSSAGLEPIQFEPVHDIEEEPDNQRALFSPTEFSEVVIPLNASGQMLTPLEVATGVPLAIAPSEKYRGKNKNRHHAFFYAVDYINGTPGQQAARLARLQRVNKVLHKYAHEYLFGTMMPATAQEEFIQTVLGHAGYVSRFGMKLDEGNFEIVELSQNQLNALRRRNTFSIQRGGESRAKIGQFLMNYAIWQDFSPAKQSEVEEFLSIKPKAWREDPVAQEKKISLASNLLEMALNVAVEPISTTYEKARQDRVVRVGAPLTAASVVIDFVKGHLADYIDTLDYRLSLATGSI